MIRILNASQIVQVCSNNERRKSGAAKMNQIEMLKDASIVLDGKSGKIHAIGTEQELLKTEWYSKMEFSQTVDMSGKSIIPGLVDGHSHPCWAGDRVGEFEMKLKGASYMDIHKAGGGIGFTVEKTVSASHEVLKSLLVGRLDRMLKQGTTLLEAKSGYGLCWEGEKKMLQVFHQVRNEHPVELSVTYLGAHSVPKSKTSAEASKDILENQIPELIRLKNEGNISPENIDVFMEKGVFNGKETEMILKAGMKAGLAANFHGDELNPMGAAELGSEIGATAISHLEHISDDGIRKMKESGVIATLLPTTAYILRIPPPPARKLLDEGVFVALGSDFNPNAHCVSMPFTMNLACIIMHMTPAEALVASTINAAASLHKAEMHGSLEVGKWANFVVINNPDWRHLIYEFGDSPIDQVWVFFTKENEISDTIQRLAEYMQPRLDHKCLLDKENTYREPMAYIIRALPA